MSGPIVTMSDQTQIIIRRSASYADCLRAYQIVLDGAVVGSVRARQSVTIPVAPGVHSLTLRIDWCGSAEIPFEVHPGENVAFECGSSLTGWRILLVIPYVLFWKQEYLWLRRAA
jgi:hypothetical protein